MKRSPSEHAQSDVLLGDRIEAISRRSRWTYGRPRKDAELVDEGIRISGKRVARLMRNRSICGASRRKTMITTIRGRDAKPAPDLVEGRFSADGPNELWVADITYVPTWSGFLYLAVVLDVFRRRVVGWAMADPMRKELAIGALDMAIFRRKPLAVVHHSDQAPRYASSAFEMSALMASLRCDFSNDQTAYVTEATRLERSAHIIRSIASRPTPSTLSISAENPPRSFRQTNMSV